MVVVKNIDIVSANNKLIIADYNQREALDYQACLFLLSEFSKKRTLRDQKIIEEILKLKNLESESVIFGDDKTIQIYLDSLEIPYSENESDYKILIRLIEKILKNNRYFEKYYSYQILVSELKKISSDSTQIIVELIRDYKYEDEVRFEYNGNLILKSELKDFHASVENLKAIISNPVTQQKQLIIGK